MGPLSPELLGTSLYRHLPARVSDINSWTRNSWVKLPSGSCSSPQPSTSSPQPPLHRFPGGRQEPPSWFGCAEDMVNHTLPRDIGIGLNLSLMPVETSEIGNSLLAKPQCLQPWGCGQGPQHLSL